MSCSDGLSLSSSKDFCCPQFFIGHCYQVNAEQKVPIGHHRFPIFYLPFSASHLDWVDSKISEKKDSQHVLKFNNLLAHAQGQGGLKKQTRFAS